MSDPEIINVTRYSTEDVLAVVNAVLPNQEWARVKIRYLFKPTTVTYSSKPFWAFVTQGYGRAREHLEIALLKPGLVPVSPLILLAQQAPGLPEMAQPRIVEDLCKCLASAHGSAAPKAAKFQAIISSGMTIRITEKPSRRTRQLSAYRNFEDKVISAKATYIASESALARARLRLKHMEAEVSALEKAVPEKQHWWGTLQAKLVLRRIKLPREIRDEIDSD